MPDGSGDFVVHGRLVIGSEAGAMSLRDALGAGHVVASCRCGHVESVDVTWWRQSRADLDASLDVLGRRVRCICGAKDLSLQVWPLAPTAPERPRTYLWRA